MFSTDGLSVYCETTHLTDFGGLISFPTTLAELKAALNFNTFTLDELADLLKNFNPADNPTIITIISVIIVSNALSLIALGFFRGRRKRFNRIRENRMFEREELDLQVQRLKQRTADIVLGTEEARKKTAAKMQNRGILGTTPPASPPPSPATNQDRRIAPARDASHSATRCVSSKVSAVRKQARRVSTKVAQVAEDRNVKEELKAFCTRLCETARNEHTVVNMLAPPDDDEALTPAQIIQLFWVAITTELFVTCFQTPAPSDAEEIANGGGRRRGGGENAAGGSLGITSAFSTINIFQAFTAGVIASLTAIFVVMLCAYVFRMGNSRKYSKHDWENRMRKYVRSVRSCLERMQQRLLCREIPHPQDEEEQEPLPEGYVRLVQHSVSTFGWVILIAGCFAFPGLNLVGLCFRKRHVILVRTDSPEALRHAAPSNSRVVLTKLSTKFLHLPRFMRKGRVHPSQPSRNRAPAPCQPWLDASIVDEGGARTNTAANSTSRQLTPRQGRYRMDASESEDGVDPQLSQGARSSDARVQAVWGEQRPHLVIAPAMAIDVDARPGRSPPPSPPESGGVGLLEAMRRAAAADAERAALAAQAKRAAAEKERREQEAAAITVQAGVRGKQAKEKTKFLLDEKALPTDKQKERAKAATKLQSRKRANAAKAEVSSKKAAQKQVNFSVGEATPVRTRVQSGERDFASPDHTGLSLMRILASPPAPKASLSEPRPDERIKLWKGIATAHSERVTGAVAQAPRVLGRHLTGSVKQASLGMKKRALQRKQTMQKRAQSQAKLMAESLNLKPMDTMSEVAQVAAAALLEKKLVDMRWRKTWVVKSRSALSWLWQWVVMVIFFFYSFIIALKFGEVSTNKMLVGWAIAYGCTFAIIEPLQIILLAAMPCLFVEDTRCGRCLIRARFIYNELLAP